MINSFIKSTGSYFPQKNITNADLCELMDTSDEWIVERTGIKNRKIAANDELTSDMAFNAAQTALKNANLSPNDIDFILFSVTYSEQSFPSTAARLQQKLNITNNCPCLDINAACTGWLYGLELANQLISSSKYNNILLIGAEKPSAFLNWEDRNTAILFGDGAGATIISKSENGKSKIIDTIIKCNSEFIDDLALVNGGQLKPLNITDFNNKYPFVLNMNGKRIFREAVMTMESLARTLLLRQSLSLDNVDWIVPHQANLRIIEALQKRLDIDNEKIALNIENFANTSSATIPTLIDQYVCDFRIKRGDLLLLTSFGAGLTSGAALIYY